MDSNQILNLVIDTISALDNDEQKLSTVIRRCIRIARLRNDYINLIWLQREIIDSKNEYERTRVFAEIIPNLTKEQFNKFNKFYLEMWMKERPALEVYDRIQNEQTDQIYMMSVGELEIALEGWIDTYNKAETPQGMHPADIAYYDDQNFRLRSISQAHINNFKTILDRIKNRVYDFLSQTEKQIIYGQIHSDIFEQNRQYVELRLGQICPEALSKFVAAYRRSKESDQESWAQALTSCRRLLKDLADSLYPPKEEPVIGADGKSRTLTDDQFKNRLWQYIFEQTGRSTSSDLLLTSVQDLGHRIDRLYELTNKGVHAEVSDFEVNQCLIQTYILVGDILRIADK